jgi:peptidase E
MPGRILAMGGRTAKLDHLVLELCADLREHVLGQDAIYVSSGNSANALAIWRAQGFDGLLREAWSAGFFSAAGARG